VISKQTETKDLQLQENTAKNILTIDQNIKQQLHGNKKALQQYIMATRNILDSWHLLVPTNEEMFSKEALNQMEQLIKRYLQQAEKHGGLKIQHEEVDLKKCPECKSEMEERTDNNGLICACGHVENVVICNDIPSAGIPNNTENSAISIRNLNDRVEHLNELMNILEGTEKYVIKKEDIITIETRMKAEKLKNETITRRQLLSIIQKEDLAASLTGHLTKIYRHITGNKVMSIGSNLRREVKDRHIEFYKCYHEYKSQRIGETHIFKAWYLLWQYLCMEGVDIDIPVDMPLMKLKETLDWHNRTMVTICDKLRENKSSRFDWKPKQLYVSN